MSLTPTFSHAKSIAGEAYAAAYWLAKYNDQIVLGSQVVAELEAIMDTMDEETRRTFEVWKGEKAMKDVSIENQKKHFEREAGANMMIYIQVRTSDDPSYQINRLCKPKFVIDPYLPEAQIAVKGAYAIQRAAQNLHLNTFHTYRSSYVLEENKLASLVIDPEDVGWRWLPASLAALVGRDHRGDLITAPSSPVIASAPATTSSVHDTRRTRKRDLEGNLISVHSAPAHAPARAIASTRAVVPSIVSTKRTGKWKSDRGDPPRGITEEEWTQQYHNADSRTNPRTIAARKIARGNGKTRESAIEWLKKIGHLPADYVDA